MFKLSIATGNAAFADPDELPRLLAEVADRVRGGEWSGTVRDTNGNRVGDYVVTDRAALAQMQSAR